MGALAEALTEAAPARRGGTCHVALLLPQLDDEDRAAFLVALDNPALSPKRIAKLMQSHGHDIGHSSIYRHGNGDCRCGR
jgi:CTP:molybdopterin cytidylyltransferase MocA